MNNTAKLISILFYVGDPISLTDISKTFKIKKDEALKEIKQAKAKLEPLGLTIIEDGQSIQLVVLSEYSALIEEFYQSSPQPLSQAALEVLSVIAYNQPINKDDIDEMRGVSSDQSIKNLLNKGLIKKVQKNNMTKYTTTTAFLKAMGIKSLMEIKINNES
jgi:segregation and condensation protein B